MFQGQLYPAPAVLLPQHNAAGLGLLLLQLLLLGPVLHLRFEASQQQHVEGALLLR
jgi:hypothetical protein